MGSVFPSIPLPLAEKIRSRFGLTRFVETGTYLGETTAWAAERFERVDTVEAFEPLFTRARQRFSGFPNVSVRFGDSPAVLSELAPLLGGPTLFWLDAHYSGQGTAGEAAECPLLDEIAAIDAGAHEHFVLIDDARMFMAPPPPPHRVADWPDLKRVIDALLERDPDALVVVVDDVIIRAPAAHRGAFSALLRDEQEKAPYHNTRWPGDDARNTLDTIRSRGLWRDGEPLRLHLGCGETMLPGYVNVDYPAERHNVMSVRPDLEADLIALTLPPGLVDEIRLHHVFEHFNRVVALGLLIRWRSWLKPGGRLVIETPDFIGTAAAAIEAAGPQRLGLVRHLEGDQSAAWAYHVGQWYPERFERTLGALGYAIASIEKTSTERYHRVPLRNVTVRAVKQGEAAPSDLVAAANRILWDSTVSDGERATFEIWKRQLRDLLDRSGAPEAPAAHAPLAQAPASAPLDPLMVRFLHALEARRSEDPSTAAIHGFNPLGRDAWVAVQAATIQPGARVLDVGAGTCPYRPLFHHAAYEAHDFEQYEGYADPARNEGLYGALDHVSDITSLPVADASFDAVLCTEVLEHVPEPIAAVAEMARVLKPGGVMILTAPLGSGLHQEPFHFYGGYTPHWYRMVSERFGLDVEEISPNGGTFRHIAQECARVSWTMGGHRHLHGELAPAVGHLFGELLPRFLTNLDDALGDAQFTVGYHVRLRKR